MHFPHCTSHLLCLVNQCKLFKIAPQFGNTGDVFCTLKADGHLLFQIEYALFSIHYKINLPVNNMSSFVFLFDGIFDAKWRETNSGRVHAHLRRRQGGVRGSTTCRSEYFLTSLFVDQSTCDRRMGPACEKKYNFITAFVTVMITVYVIGKYNSQMQAVIKTC